MHHELDDNESRRTNPSNPEPMYIALCAEQLKLAIAESRAEMDGLTQAAIIGGGSASMDMITRLQSVDRLMQRLSNVQANLERLAEFLTTKADHPGALSWEELLASARASFTMAQEREVFDQIIGNSHGISSSPSDTTILFNN